MLKFMEKLRNVNWKWENGVSLIAIKNWRKIDGKNYINRRRRNHIHPFSFFISKLAFNYTTTTLAALQPASHHSLKHQKWAAVKSSSTFSDVPSFSKNSTTNSTQAKETSFCMNHHPSTQPQCIRTKKPNKRKEETTTEPLTNSCLKLSMESVSTTSAMACKKMSNALHVNADKEVTAYPNVNAVAIVQFPWKDANVKESVCTTVHVWRKRELVIPNIASTASLLSAATHLHNASTTSSSFPIQSWPEYQHRPSPKPVSDCLQASISRRTVSFSNTLAKFSKKQASKNSAKICPKIAYFTTSK